jgi:hypothetical protein
MKVLVPPNNCIKVGDFGEILCVFGKDLLK